MTAPTELWFHEQMTGFFTWGATDPRTGEQQGKSARTWFGFDLTIMVNDLDVFLANRNTNATVTGHYLGNLFAGAQVNLDSGTFKFMSPGPAETRLMEHRHTFTYDHKKYTFVGTKYLDDDPLQFDMIQDLTTLYSQIHDENGAIVAAGVLHFPMKDFARLVASFDTRGPGAGFMAKMRFLKMFLREELHVLLEGYKPVPEPPKRRRSIVTAHSALDQSPDFDVVIVGSGYGGGATAARLAAWRDGSGKGKRIGVFERGKEWRAGDFPDEPWEMPGALRHASNPMGLLELHFAGDIDVLVGNGLGGTSLINANVMIEPESQVFKQSGWPANMPALAPYFARAKTVLQPAEDPVAPLKTTVFTDAVSKVGGCTATRKLSLAVAFQDVDRTHDTGNSQTACIRCGGCVTGCNFTSKSTVDMTYLSIAEKQGAEIYTGLEVRSVVATASGAVLKVFDHETQSLRTIEAKQVIIAAGVLGSFSLLTRSKVAGLAVSDALGTCFSGNGDVLGFGYNSDVETDSSFGTTITSIGEFRSDPDPKKHFIIEEGGVPRALTALLRAALPVLKLHGKDTDHGFADGLKEWLRIKADEFGFQSYGALEHSLVYLGMGTEETYGQLEYNNDRIRVQWPNVSNLPFAKRIDDAMYATTAVIGGTYLQNPEPRGFLGDDLITVHPLGGCPMGDDPKTSVVDVHGALHHYPGKIFVADGSIMPTALGVNPAFTIAALGEWIADGIASKW
jgi:cholesterol oxidase